MSLSINIDYIRSSERAVVQNLQLEIPRGRIATLMGASGSGKSSVLAVIAGTLSENLSAKASILLNDKRLDSMPTYQRKVGLLFQDDLLFAHMTVAENLLFAIPAGDKQERNAKVKQALEEADLNGFGSRDPATLSGGQRARVALMRALLANPEALLLDEPFSKLDFKLRANFRNFVFSHIQKRQIPALLVTHDSLDIAEPAMMVELSDLQKNANAR